MQPSDRERLEARKQRLRATLIRSRDGEYLRPLVTTLRQPPTRCSRVSVRALASILGPVMALEGKGDRIDWAQLPEGACNVWDTRPDRDALFRRALGELARPTDRIIVAWHPLRAGLRIRAGDADRLAPDILDAAPDLWVVPADRPGWLIEVAHFDHQVCYARTLARRVP